MAEIIYICSNLMNYKEMKFVISLFIAACLLCGCSGSSSSKGMDEVDSVVVADGISYEDDVVFNSIFVPDYLIMDGSLDLCESVSDELFDVLYSNHVITGQKAAEEIVGKFDGVHLDTLYIERTCNYNPDSRDSLDMAANIDGYNDAAQYFLCSRSGRLPKMELYGCNEMMPLMYKEGDLDGNGTDDVGYLHTWTTSQWRYYRILTFLNGKWCYMFGEEEPYLSTSSSFRHSGYEIAKPAEQKGKVCIAYMLDGFEPVIKDTIVTPHFTQIEVNN